ncbi:hypothetical protein [Micromonospora sp. NPDC049171]|uniref:hypothetical protein n=1 Tax=Micromonospora sp. NPDC049171 TaxID=3155770 RepID=UPI0033F1E9F1
MLLYGQSVSRIVVLRIDHVTDSTTGISAARMGIRLTDLGFFTRAGRATALMELGAELPPVVLSSCWASTSTQQPPGRKRPATPEPATQRHLADAANDHDTSSSPSGNLTKHRADRLPAVPLAPNDTLTEHAAIRLAGDDIIVCETHGASVFLGNDAMVIIAERGNGLDVSGVSNSRRFHLHGPLVGAVGVRLFGHPPTSPQWSWAGRRDVRPIHLLTRLPAGCLYLGLGKHEQSHHSNGVMISAELTITPELTGDLLDRVRPPTEPDTLPDQTWLANIQASPTTALNQFVEGWVPETDEDLGEFPSSGWTLPEPLTAFYRLARHRPALLGQQNFLRRPEEWKLAHDGLIDFGHENQGGFIWLFDPSDADPVVWIDQDDYGLRPEHERMSGFLLKFAVYETMMNAHYKALSTELEAEHVEIVTARLTPLPWKPWRWPNDSTRFFVAPGMIAEVTDSGHGKFSMWIGAAHRSVLRPLRGLEIPWTRFEG